MKTMIIVLALIVIPFAIFGVMSFVSFVRFAYKRGKAERERMMTNSRGETEK